MLFIGSPIKVEPLPLKPYFLYKAIHTIHNNVHPNPVLKISIIAPTIKVIA